MPESARDQLIHALARLDATEANVRAYRHVFVDAARAAAIKVDACAAASDISGWPFAVKEVFDVKDVSTSGGSLAFSNRVPNRDACVVQRLRDAGAVLVGTQISHELTCGVDEPPTRNPWDIGCYPGGSSAGAGVSVAVGSARFTLGTDAAGSVRIPAAMTGTTGFKPTEGRVSAAGVFRQATAPSIDNVGIIARTVVDLHSVLSVIEGPNAEDMRTLRSDFTALGTLELPNLLGITLAVLGPETKAALNAVFPIEPCIETAFDAACMVYLEAGVQLVEVEIPELATAIDVVVTLFSAELAAAHRDCLPESESRYFPAIAEMLKAHLSVGSDILRAAVAQRSVLRLAVDRALENTEASGLLTPTTPRVAMKLAGFVPSQDLGSLIPYTCPFNLTGHPALSLPSGFSKTGLPIGHQVIGKIGQDQFVLQLGHMFQTMTDWHARRPNM